MTASPSRSRLPKVSEPPLHSERATKPSLSASSWTNWTSRFISATANVAVSSTAARKILRVRIVVCLLLFIPAGPQSYLVRAPGGRLHGPAKHWFEVPSGSAHRHRLLDGRGQLQRPYQPEDGTKRGRLRAPGVTSGYNGFAPSSMTRSGGWPPGWVTGLSQAA